jgi:hypothetical protein
MNFASGALGGEPAYVWDGAKLTRLTVEKAPDGASVSPGNTWSPHSINNNGKAAWALDIADGTGSPYVMVYDTVAGTFTTVMRPTDPAPGGGVYGAASNGLRQVVDINDNDQVAFPNTRTAADGTDHNAIYVYDLNTKTAKLVAANGTKLADGKTITDAWWPDINNRGQISFTASVDGEFFGMYRAEPDGTITPIILPNSTIDGVQIGSARRSHEQQR